MFSKETLSILYIAMLSFILSLSAIAAQKQEHQSPNYFKKVERRLDAAKDELESANMILMTAWEKASSQTNFDKLREMERGGEWRKL